MTNISFVPEGVIGQQFFEQQGHLTPTYCRILGVMVNAAWCPGLAKEDMRLVPVPSAGYDLFRHLTGLLPYAATREQQETIINEVRAMQQRGGWTTS